MNFFHCLSLTDSSLSVPVMSTGPLLLVISSHYSIDTCNVWLLREPDSLTTVSDLSLDLLTTQVASNCKFQQIIM